MRIWVKYCIGFICLLLLTACHDQDVELRQVDALIAMRQTIQEGYQARLDSLHIGMDEVIDGVAEHAVRGDARPSGRNILLGCPCPIVAQIDREADFHVMCLCA